MSTCLYIYIYIYVYIATFVRTKLVRNFRRLINEEESITFAKSEEAKKFPKVLLERKKTKTKRKQKKKKITRRKNAIKIEIPRSRKLQKKEKINESVIAFNFFVVYRSENVFGQFGVHLKIGENVVQPIDQLVIQEQSCQGNHNFFGSITQNLNENTQSKLVVIIVV